MKKGMELTMNTIVIAAVLLILVVVMIIIFTGSTKDFLGGLSRLKCESKIKAACTPEGPEDDTKKCDNKNTDGLSDTKSYSISDDNGRKLTGECLCVNMAEACKDYNKR
ncbi:MAG: hypothetical protein QXK37_02260 [Candidatus Woesearchaeota archaeon]